MKTSCCSGKKIKPLCAICCISSFGTAVSLQQFQFSPTLLHGSACFYPKTFSFSLSARSSNYILVKTLLHICTLLTPPLYCSRNIPCHRNKLSGGVHGGDGEEGEYRKQDRPFLCFVAYLHLERDASFLLSLYLIRGFPSPTTSLDYVGRYRLLGIIHVD